MRVIPVLDLAGGLAVHARGGVRAAYAPVQSVLSPVAGDAARLAGAYRDVLGLAELYIADLDAITAGAPAAGLTRLLAGSGVRVWLDAGVSGAPRAEAAVRAGADIVVVALETLPSVDALGAVLRAVPERSALSLDVRGDVVVRDANASGVPRDPLRVAELAVERGIRRILVLDLARIGTERGANLSLPRAIRERWPEIELVIGGGIRDAEDVRAAANAGADAVLVGTALHQGRIGTRELARLGELGGAGGRRAAPPGDSQST